MLGVRRASNSALWKPGAGHSLKGRTEKATDNAVGQVRVGRRMWLEKTEIKSNVVGSWPSDSRKGGPSKKAAGSPGAEVILMRVLKWNKGENRRWEID